MRALLFILAMMFAVPAFAADKMVGKESAYARVMRTGTLRCGYFSWPPYMSKDPNTGAFQGFIYDYVQTLAARMGVKIDWTAEVVYGNIYQEIKDGKIDAFCSGIWPTAGLAKLLDFTTPIGYTPLLAFVRADDNRFDGDLNRLNDPGVKIATMEGSIAGIIAGNRFPKAKIVETPMVSGPSSQIMDVVAGKSDVAFIDWGLVNEYAAGNPGKIRAVSGVAPLNVWGNTIAFGKHSEPLVNAVNTVTQEMLYSGEIDRLFDQYNMDPKNFYRVTRPYNAQP